MTTPQWALTSLAIYIVYSLLGTSEKAHFFNRDTAYCPSYRDVYKTTSEMRDTLSRPKGVHNREVPLYDVVCQPYAHPNAFTCLFAHIMQASACASLAS